jgi:lysophospholipase L1-like esterase
VRAFLQNVVLAFLSLGLVLGLLELGARALSPAHSAKATPALDQYMTYDARLGWRKRPGARVEVAASEYKVEVAINAHGLRDVERPYEKPPGCSRVLALGDSFVEGYTVPLEQTVTRVLEARLSGRGCPVEVLNGGTSGYSTDQEALFYEDEGAKYRPDLVLVFFYYNDVLFNVRDRYGNGDPKPVLVSGTAGLEAVPAPGPRPPPPPAEGAGAEGRAEPRGSALLQWVGSRLRRGAPRAYNALARLGLWAKALPKAPAEQLHVYRRHASPEIREAWERTSLILGSLRDEAAKNQAAVEIVYVPSRMEVSDRDWSITQFEYQMRDTHWDRGEVLRRISGIAASLGIPFLDLTPALRARNSDLFGGPYFVYDGHWNRQGHEVAADEIARFLVSTKALACASKGTS